MKTEIGEFLVGAYLTVIEKCDLISYNVKHPEKGIEGLAEFDVIGLNFENKTAYLCEVVTHLNELRYGKRLNIPHKSPNLCPIGIYQTKTCKNS